MPSLAVSTSKPARARRRLVIRRTVSESSTIMTSGLPGWTTAIFGTSGATRSTLRIELRNVGPLRDLDGIDDQDDLAVAQHRGAGDSGHARRAAARCSSRPLPGCRSFRRHGRPPRSGRSAAAAPDCCAWTPGSDAGRRGAAAGNGTDSSRPGSRRAAGRTCRRAVGLDVLHLLDHRRRQRPQPAARTRR